MKRVLNLTNGHKLTDFTITLYGGNCTITKYRSFDAYDNTLDEWVPVVKDCGFYYEDDYDEDYDEENEEYYRTYYEDGDTWEERLTNYIIRTTFEDIQEKYGINFYDYKVKVIYR